jgi:uncharacterized repeat protein (TIGR01451 family)
MKIQFFRLLTLVLISTFIAAPVSAGFLQEAPQQVSSPSQTGQDVSRQSGAPVLGEAEGETNPANYIIMLKDAPAATYTGGISGLPATSPAVTSASQLDSRSATVQAYVSYLEGEQDRFLSSVSTSLGRQAEPLFRYMHAFNGVALFLTPAEARQVAKLEGVVQVEREKEEVLLSDAGPAFIGAGSIWGGGFESLSYFSALSGANEVPPNGSTATGTGAYTYNFATRVLTWNITHSLPALTGAHFHLGAAGVNGGVVIPLDHTTNPITGSAVLTAQQQGYLVNATLYVNLHTAAFPGGEIRDQLWLDGTLGEGVIVGILDTGINHDHPSFAAVGGDGYMHTNPFGSGSYVGYCATNPSFCNNKLIGAWDFHPTALGPEDTNGHGSHTASTVAGNILQDAQMIAPTATYTFPFISGVAPHANIIAYKVCEPSCPTASTTAAVNQAVIDGVDVINYSISGGTSPYTESTSIAFLNANTAGVITAASAGNSGPAVSTVNHQEPWTITVAASTHNRTILNSVVGLNSSSGPLADILGESPTAAFGPAPLVYAGAAPYNNPLCNPFPAGTFSGQIVVCDRGVIGRVQKGINVLAAGGGGMILANDAPSAASLNADTHVLPATHISYADGIILKTWMSSGSGHVGRITGGSVDYTAYPGDNMASFSSRGPATTMVATIKPDITAPGLNILAAYNTAGNPPPPEFNIISGTSMSSPHTAGAAALMRAVYPSWTPAEIKSAMMLSANPNVNKEDNTTPGDPFDFGAGRVALDQAPGVGLVMNITRAQYDAANPGTGGDPKQLNLPSMSNPNCVNSCTWTRTVKSVLSSSQTYSAAVSAPAGMAGTVTPASFTLAPGAEQVLTITLNITNPALSGWKFAAVNITGVGSAPMRMPIAVVPSLTLTPPAIQVAPSSLSSTQFQNEVTQQSLSISNLGQMDLTWTITEAEAAAGLQSTFSEGFDDITNLPGWFMQNNSSPLGLTNWFQGNSGVFPAHSGAPASYIGANFNNTSGVGTISNWLLTPAMELRNGDSFSFWTRGTGSNYPDRLEVRLSTNGSSTNVGTLATDVGDFTTLLLSINPSLVAGGYPDAWTQYTVNVSGVPGAVSGRIAFRYFVTGGGPSGSNSDYIGIDTFEYTSSGSGPCDLPADAAWLSVSPSSGTTAGGASSDVTVTFDATGQAVGTYTANLCVTNNDPTTPLVVVPVSLEVVESAFIQVAHLAPFAEDASVTVTLNGAPALTNFEYGDSTGYIQLPTGTYDVAVIPTGTSDPAIEATVELMADTYYTVIAAGDGLNQDLTFIVLEDNLSAPAAGKFHLRLGHLAPFAALEAVLADIRLQDGTPILENVDFGEVTGFLPLDAGTYDLKITTPGGAVTLIDPAPVTFTEGMIISAFASGNIVNQPLGVFALPAGDPGFFLPLAESDLSVEFSISPLPVIVGQPTTFTAVVTNHGPSPVSGVVVSGELPENVEFISGVNCSVEGSILTCDLGTIGVDESKTAVVVLEFTAAGSFEIGIEVIGDLVDPVPGNNAGTVTIEVTQPAVQEYWIYAPIIRRGQ